MSKEKEYKSLFICGYCDNDTRSTGQDIQKVNFAGYANMLCTSCRFLLDVDMKALARKYLNKALDKALKGE